MLGVGKLLEIRDQKWDEVAERLTMELELDKQRNSTKKGSYILCNVLLLVVDRLATVDVTLQSEKQMGSVKWTAYSC